MPSPRILILRAPGTNCDEETAFAFEQAGGRADRVHINRFVENPLLADDYQVLCIPGGFSYGDDLAAGRIFALNLTHHLTDAIERLRASDKLVLGICNGFQVLLKTGLLSAADSSGPTCTLTFNTSARFEDRWVQLRVAENTSPLLRGIDSLSLPIAHAEGRFVARDAATLQRLDEQRQLVLRYVAESDDDYPANPNGSQACVAGMCDETGRVFGLMPHPERFLHATQHPQWTRRERAAAGEGLQFFTNAVEYFA